MPIVARFSFDVPFGRKPDLFKLYEKWTPVARELGFPKARVAVGSIGAPESRVEEEFVFENLAQLEQSFAKLNDSRVAAVTGAMAELVVPGSHRWEVLRIHSQ